MIRPAMFLKHVIRPTLAHLATINPNLGSRASEQLMLGTAIAESRLNRIHQVGKGNAKGFFQIEASFDYDAPATFEDIYERYLRGRPGLLVAIQDLRCPALTTREQLAGNPFFGCGIARIKFWMQREPLPQADDLDGFGRYYKRYYNTASGAGSAAGWVHLYRKYVKE